MDAWEAAALLGTEQRLLPALGQSSLDKLVQEYLANQPPVHDSSNDVESDPSLVLLLRSGLRSVMATAGIKTIPCILPITSTTPQQTASGIRACTVKQGRVIESILMAPTFHVLLTELASILLVQSVTLPSHLLPLILQTKDKTLQELMKPLLGERGRWLAQQNPEWAWAIELANESREELLKAWHESKSTDRLAAIARLHRDFAEDARELLCQTLTNERADFRSKVMAALADQLSIDDHNWLLPLLTDRSSQVRRQAEYLLLKEPQSAWCRELADDSVSKIRIVGTNSQPQWEIKFPDHLKNDERHRWLELAIAATPIIHWNAASDASADKILRATLALPEGEAILNGLMYAATLAKQNTTPSSAFSQATDSTDERNRLTAWQLALMRYWYQVARERPQDNLARQSMQALGARLPASELARVCSELLSIAPTLTAQLLSGLATPWPAPLIQSIFDQTERRIHGHDPKSLLEWVDTLRVFILHAAPNDLEDLQVCLAMEPSWNPSWHTNQALLHIYNLTALLEQRIALLRAFSLKDNAR